MDSFFSKLIEFNFSVGSASKIFALLLGFVVIRIFLAYWVSVYQKKGELAALKANKKK